MYANGSVGGIANGKVLQIAFLRFWIIYKMCLLMKPSD